MTIDRIGSPDPIQPGKKASQTETARIRSGSDSVAFSSEAKEKSELYRALELVSVVQDTRGDRIEAVKAKLRDPNYINDTVVQTTADRIATLFGF